MTAPEPPADDQEYGSWDDFWAEVERAEAAERGQAATTTIRGVTVPIPHDLRLRFDRKLDRLKDSASEDDIRSLLEDLFGADVLDAWVENGMKSREFRVVLRWAVANARGRPMTFREAYEAVRADEGKAKTTPNPASTPSSAASGDSGPSSRRISPASTASRRRGSQT